MLFRNSPRVLTNILAIVTLCCVGGCMKPSLKNCLGGPGKCNGNILCTEGSLVNHTRQIGSTIYNVSKEICSEICIDTDACIRSVYFRDNNTCHLFRDGQVVEEISISTVCYWVCCKNEDCKRTAGMCRGYWVQYERKKLVNAWELSRYTGKMPDPYTCLDLCQKNPICVSVNYGIQGNNSNNICQLFKFAPPFSKMKQSSYYTALKWHCCSYDDSDIPNDCETGAGKCIGRWKKSSKKPRSDTRVVNMFHSRNKFGCLKACRRNPHCTIAYYNQTKYLCMLKSNASKQANPCHQYNYLWHGYHWQCCKGDESATKTAAKMPVESRKCMCFNSPIWVAANNCHQPNPQQRVVLNSKHTALWVLNERSFNGWVPYHNGYMKIWVKTSGKYNSRPCETIHCNIFSTPIDAICPRVIPRANWFANAQKPGLLPFQTTPHYVNIMDTGKSCPLFGCYTEASCASVLRIDQYYQQNNLGLPDLMYSFAVGSDGSLFEVRGTEFRTGDTLDYKTITIIIAFLGHFNLYEPTVASLRAVKQLLFCLQHSGNITVDFKLFPNSDMSAIRKNPGILLKDLLQNWPHYKGIPFSEIPCPSEPILWPMFLSNGVAFFLFCVILAITIRRYRRVWRHADWCPVRSQRLSPNAIRLCELDDHGLLLAQMKDLPGNCLIRDCQTWRLSISTLPFVILQTEPDCACVRQLQQLWFLCSFRALEDFPRRAAAFLTSRRCPATTVLEMGISLPFIIHSRHSQRLLGLIGEVATQRCVCTGKGKVHGAFMRLTGVEDFANKIATSGWSEKWSGWMEEADVDPRQLQQVFVRRGGGVVEVTYREFLLHPDLLSASEELEDELAPLVLF